MPSTIRYLLRGILIVSCFANCISSKAESGPAPAPDPCANVSTPTTDKPEIQAVYDSIRLACAERTLNSVRTASQNDKTTAIVGALSALGTIQGQSGAITNPTNADHIGEWYAQQLLFKSAAAAGAVIKPLASNKRYIFSTDPKTPAVRVGIQATLGHVNAMTAAMGKLSDLANSEIPKVLAQKEKAPATKESKKQVPAIFSEVLPAIPALVSVVKGIAGIFKTDSTLSALPFDTANQGQLILSGLCSTGCPYLYVSGSTADATRNQFIDAYGALLSSVATARNSFANLQSAMDKVDQEKTLPSAVAVRDSLKAQLAQFDNLDKTYHTPDTSTMTTPYEIFAQRAGEVLAPNSQTGLLVIAPIHYKGHSGVVKSWSGESLIYETTTSLSYVLFEADGTIGKTGVIFDTFNVQMKANPNDREKNLPILEVIKTSP